MERTLGNVSQQWARKELDAASRPMSVVHGVAFGDHHLEPTRSENGSHLIDAKAFDPVSSFFFVESKAEPYSQGRNSSSCRLGNTDGATGDTSHFCKALKRTLNVMESVVDVHDVN
jgi:hypothetical protein